MIERTPLSLRDQGDLHEQVERLAVCQFDWVMGPVEGVVDAMAYLASHHPHMPKWAHHPHMPRWARRHPAPAQPAPDGAAVTTIP